MSYSNHRVQSIKLRRSLEYDYLQSGPGMQYLAATTISQSGHGYFTSPQSVIYDDKRQALYAISSAQFPRSLSEYAIVFYYFSR